MEQATRKTRTIERKLKKVEALPVANEEEFYEIDTVSSLPDTTDNIV